MDTQKKLITVTVISLLATGISSTLLLFYFRSALQPFQVQSSSISAATTMSNNSPVTHHAVETMWLTIQKQVKDTVVQVYAQTTEFNWLEPYKSPEQGEGVGSGFFINASGDLITNYHVVAQASSVQIQIPSFGMERFDTEIIGVSPDRDIALLRITPEARDKIKEKLKVIPYLRLGNSDKILRSQEVLALGYPLGQTRLKSTLGIVSGRERLGIFGYIQITAPLNPGNSGGPALNTNGEVIGINSCGILNAQNVGYIIPINEVRSALDDLHKVKLLRKPMLGCAFTPATTDMVKYLGNPGDGGWYIAKVFPDSLLESVGVKENDMLYEINGYKIDIYGDLNVPWSEDKVSLFELLNRYKIGDPIEFIIYRNGTRKNFSFKLEQKHLPCIRTMYPEFEPEAKDYEMIGGMTVMEITFNHIELLISRCPELVRYLSKSENQHDPALIITNILPNSQAYKAKVLHRGSIIEKINGQKAKTLKEFRQLVLKSKASGFITLNTEDNLLGVLNVEKIVKEENGLAALYFFRKSNLIDVLSTAPQLVDTEQHGPDTKS